MSLPFLQKKKIAGVIISHRKPDEAPITESPNDDGGLEACAQDLIDATHAQDKKAAAAAMRAAFSILESEPHEEAGEGPEPHSYDAQNEKAGGE